MNNEIKIPLQREGILNHHKHTHTIIIIIIIIIIINSNI